MEQRLFSGQRQDFVVLVLAGGLAAAAGVAAIVRDLVRILPNRDVPVTVELTDIPHELRLNGTVGAEATEGVVRVSDLDPASLAVVLAAALLPALTLLVVAVCFTLLGRSFFRSEFFTRANLVAINTAAATLGVGSVLIPTLGDMATNSALASLDVVSGLMIVFGVDAAMFLAGFLLAVLGYAFQRGARLQDDTEGLV